MCGATNDANGLRVTMSPDSYVGRKPNTIYLSKTHSTTQYYPYEASKWTLKKSDGLYEVLAPGSVVQNTIQFTSVIREPRKLEVKVRNTEITKIGTRDERKTKLTE